jgi:hypothetical protein
MKPSIRMIDEAGCEHTLVRKDALTLKAAEFGASLPLHVLCGAVSFSRSQAYFPCLRPRERRSPRRPAAKSAHIAHTGLAQELL